MTLMEIITALKNKMYIFLVIFMLAGTFATLIFALM